MSGKKKGDIEAVFPEANVTDTPDQDYAFRADISRSTVEEAMLRAVRNINYGNFKGSISNTSRHDEYLEVWGLWSTTRTKGTTEADPINTCKHHQYKNKSNKTEQKGN